LLTETWKLPATALAALIRAREVSAREVAMAALARLDAVNPRLNAVVSHRPDEVLAAADAVDAIIAGGGDAGLLGGVPVTVKVNTDQEGHATTNGLRMQKDLIATSDSPVVSNLKKAGAVILGRTNTPAFSLRWFTDNQLHGRTRNPRDKGLTPGGSSGGAASAVASGIGAIGHGTDIGGSIRYPAYACGVHGLRPSLGRVPAWNSSGPERTMGGQLMAVSGPIARTIADVRLGLEVMAAADPRDPWYTPQPMVGRPVPRKVALCLRPNGMAVAPEVIDALKDAAMRLEAAGYIVEEVADTPSFREATEMQVKLWLGDGYAGFAANVAREGDPAAMMIAEAFREMATALPADIIGQTLVRRATLTRVFQEFLDDYPILLVPVSGMLPFADDADMGGPDAFKDVWEAQLVQTGLPLMSMPGLVVSTGMVGTAPMGVQLIASRYREDLLLDAGAAIEAGGMPPSPIDPVWA
jgi:amidase